MAKHLNISLGVSADTSKAKAQLQDLQNQLTKIINSPTSNRMDLAKEIREASQAAAELQAHLKNATNVDTGTLDFTKLSNSLKQSGQTLESYAQKLVRVGPEGRQAFQKLTTSVAQSEIPIKRVNKQLTKMWTTLKNNARWQISSSILHGFMGAVSSAYGYAQDLNESLTNIRIVTGQNTDQMARFAKEANAAAKALSTTTTRYTNASLIYYQQGLSDEEVKKRTDITVKMANAAGASAETVSDQLTAVWNNFYDGTKSLEHYADVMTALGAATASSTDEIAGGLEKFAAVADTIGLSYEYAASALATITSNTRQSEEVVGTALKTIFARIQGLNLGETLEDGTSLNKYSEALAKVGIDIFEVNGEIKEMDNILNELGAKWQQLGKDQQIALAQTVAGVRQYNQLVSLMDNWNNGDNDSFQANLDTAQNSEGALQEQADIYAEGWEAASDRVRASMEGIYETIIDDEAFITMLDYFAEIIQYVDRLIDGMGGLGGVISSVLAVSTKLFNKQIAQQMRDTAYGISMMTIKGRQQYYDNKQKQVDKLTGMASDMRGKSSSTTDQAWATGVENSAKLRTILEQNSANMTAEQITTAQARIEAAERTAKEVEEKARKFDEAKSSNRDIKEQVRQIGIENANISSDSEKTGIAAGLEQQKKYNELEKKYTDYYKQFRNIDKMVTDQAMVDKKTVKEMYSLADKLGIKHLDTDIELFTNDDQKEITEAVISDFNALGDELKNVILNSIQNELGIIDDDLTNKIKDSIQTQGNLASDVEQAQDIQRKEQEENEKFIREQGQEGRVYDWADKATAVADVALSLTSSIQALGGIKDIINDDTLSDWEKFSSIISTVAINFPMMLSSVTQLITVFGGATKITTGAIKGMQVATAFLNPSLAATSAASGAAATGIGGLASAFGSLMIAAAPWLAIAALVVGSIIAIDEAFVTEEEAADEAAKSAKKLAEEYDRVNESYQNLKNTLSNYQEAKDGISELTKGTQEYKEAVLAANEQALTLLETNKGLEYTVDDNGLINIDNEALEKLQQERLEGLTNAQNMKILSKQKAAETSVDLERSKLKSGANKETTFNVLAKEYNSGNTAMFASDEIFETELLKIFENMRPGDDALEAMVKEREAIEKLIQELNKNTAIQESNNKLIAQNSFGEEISNSGLNDSGQDLLGSILGNSISQYKSEHLDEYNKTSTYQWDAMGSAKALGESYGYTLKEFNGAGGATYTYTDANGKELETSFTIDEIIDFAILQDASNEISDELQNHIDTIAEGTKNLTDTQIEALSSFANGEIGDLSKLTADEIKALEEDLDGGLKDLINLLNNGQDINDAFEQAEANITKARTNYMNSLTFDSIEGYGTENVTEVSEAFNRLVTGALSNVALDTQKQVGDILKNAFLQGGAEGLVVAEQLFKAAGTDAQEVANIVSNMDWQNATLEDFNNKLEDAGIDLSNASSALANFVAWIEKVRGVATAASNSDYYNTTQEVLEQMVAGGTLSAEKIEELRKGSEQDRAIADTFEYQANGTYMYNGGYADAAMAEEYFKQQYNDRFIGSAQGYYEEAQQIEGLKGQYDTLSQRGGKTDSELIEQQMFAIENLLKDKLSENEQARYAQLINKSGEDMNRYDRQFLADIIKNNKDAFSVENLDRAAEDSRFEAEKNMQAAYSTQESPEDIDNVTEALGNSTEAMEAAAAAKQKLNDTRLEELGIEKEELEELAEAYIEAGDSIEEAYRKAEEALRLNNGLEKLIDNWKTYNKVLQEGSESSPEYVKTMNELQSILSDITGVTDKEIFTKDWIKKNQGNLDQLAKGSTKAISNIRKAAADEILVKASGVESFDQVANDFKEIHNYLWDYARNNNIEVGAKIDNAQFLDACNEIVAAAGFTAEQAGEYFKALGYNVEVETQEKTEESEIAYDGQWFDTMTGEPKEIHTKLKRTETLKVPVVKSITYTGEGGGKVNFSNTAAGGAGSSGGGGGSDEPTKMEYTKEIDFYDRYKEWDDALDDIDDLLSDIQKEEDALYGQNKISAMKKRNKVLLEEVEALQQKKKEAEAYFEIDKQNLQNAAAELGYNIDFGSRDQILNYTSTMQGLFDELHAMEVHFNSLGSGKAQQEYKKNVLDPFNQKVDDLKQYIDQYDETRELLEDLDNEITDSVLEWKGLNYDILHYELEIKVEINDIALTRLDYYLKKYEDDFYSLSESAAVLFDKLEPTLNKLKAYGDFYEDTTKIWDSTTQQYGEIMEGVTESTKEANEERLDAMSGGLVGAFSGVGVVENSVEDYYKQAADGPIAVGEAGYIDALSRDITQADYAEGLKEVIEGMYEELGNLDEIDKQFMEFYGQAIEMAREELEFYTGSLEHLTNSLKHYNKVAEITGRTNDIAFSKKMLDAQAKMVENQLSVAASNYEMYKQQQEHWKAQLATAVEGSAEWELYQENLKKAVKATEEAQDEMLSKTEEWAEALKAILENNLTDASRILENALTGGTSFDAMNKALERAESLQEEYLTDTNKIYETEKLMRQTRQEIDKTTNNAAKLRLNMFLTETEQLQTQNRLSEYELSIQQAKYQLLLAELAVEEAKNAKSTVRLQRDFEGNFGYVYTADQDQIDSAMQNLDDKRNELYNIGLEGANNYTSKYLSTLEAMYDEFNTIQQNNLNGMYESEQEFQNAMTEAYEYYFAKLKEYEELYGIAIRTDSNVTAEAWSTDFQDMIYNTEVWADECEIYITQVTDLFEEWGETSEDLNQIIEDTTGTIDEIVRASDELAASINDNVVPGLQQELDLLNEILKAYGLIRDEILEEQKYREEQAARAEQDLREEAERDDYDDDDDFEQEKPTKADRTNNNKTTPTSDPNPNPKPPSSSSIVQVWTYDTASPKYEGKMTYEKAQQTIQNSKDKEGKIYGGGTNSGTIDKNFKVSQKYLEDKEEELAAQMATGGYTGAWGPEGKTAILHEKELVLNKTDTQNILEAVDMVRQISTGIDQQVSYQRIATLITQTLQDKKDNDVLEQHVTIEARFDNVRDRYEIEAAFDNLINKASQYANRDYKASAPAKINRTGSAKSF